MRVFQQFWFCILPLTGHRTENFSCPLQFRGSFLGGPSPGFPSIPASLRCAPHLSCLAIALLPLQPLCRQTSDAFFVPIIMATGYPRPLLSASPSELLHHAVIKCVQGSGDRPTRPHPGRTRVATPPLLQSLRGPLRQRITLVIPQRWGRLARFESHASLPRHAPPALGTK